MNGIQISACALVGVWTTAASAVGTELALYDGKCGHASLSADGKALSVTGQWDVSPYAETIDAIRWVGDNMYRIRFEDR